MLSTPIGRHGELGAIDAFLDALPGGRCVLLLEGEPGIGKTLLFRQGSRRARALGFRVLPAHPTSSETQLSYAGLGDILGALSWGVLADLPAPQRDALEVALLRAEAKGSAPPPRAVAVGLLGILQTLARHEPVLVAVDDLQWLDGPSLSALEFAMRRVSGPVGVLATQRPLPGRALDEHWPRGDDRVRILQVGPLGGDELRRIIHTRLGITVPRYLVVQLERVSGGNPFFALEIARTVAARGHWPEPGELLSVPGSLRELVRDRLARLPEHARLAALAVAALSRPSAATVEQAITFHAAPSAGLKEAVEAGVIELDGDRVTLTHPLLGSVLYSETTPAERREMHRRLAEIVCDSEEQARHRARAAPAPDGEVAAALEAAAIRAVARGAPSAAAELTEEACRLTPPAEDREARRRALRAAEYHFQAGDVERAESLYEKTARDVGQGPELATVLNGLGRLRFFRNDQAAAIRAYREALQHTGESPGLSGSVHEGLGWSIWALGDLRTATRHLAQAVCVAEVAGDPLLLAETLAECGYMQTVAGQGMPAEAFRRALAIEGHERAPRILRRPSAWFAVSLQCAGELVEASKRQQEVLREAREAGDELSLAYLLTQVSETERLLGRWDAALHHADEAIEVAVLLEQPGVGRLARAARAMVEALRGRPGRAADVCPDDIGPEELTSPDPTAMFGSPWHAPGLFALSRGEYGAAHRYLGLLVSQVIRIGIGEPNLMRCVPDDVEALVGMGELDEAERLLGPFEERAGSLRREWAVGAAARCRGLLLADSQDREGAILSLKAAVERHGSIPEPFELARTLLALGGVLRRTKQKRAARASLERALEIFDELGAALWARRSRGELERVGGRAPGPRGLTPTEERLADLVAEGRTNREVAAALSLSVKTVEGNLTRIYRKLGVRSRIELTRRVLEGQ